jgi:hypothetical protein
MQGAAERQTGLGAAFCNETLQATSRLGLGLSTAKSKM